MVKLGSIIGGVLDVDDASDVGILCRADKDLCVDDVGTFKDALFDEWPNSKLQAMLGVSE